MRREDRDALAVLTCLASLTAGRLLPLAVTFGTAAACLDAVLRGQGTSEADRRAASLIEPAEVLARTARAGARFVTLHDAEYPPGLRELFDPPAALYVRGELPLDRTPWVAIVGARNASPGGREIATDLARAVVSSGGCVVSGAARGIDAAAHRGALAGGGSTVAVLGSGIDVPYPASSRELLSSMLTSGAVVSEYPPGTRAEPFRFPARNRIVAALSVAVVVVEGASGSGSMITADHALELGREVMAVPGPVTSELAEAPLALIRDGAGLLRGPDDLLADLGIEVERTTPNGGGSRGGSGKAGAVPDGLSSEEAAVWMALSAPGPVDRLSREASLAPPRAIAALMGLELRGLVRQVGGRYERRRRGVS